MYNKLVMHIKMSWMNVSNASHRSFRNKPRLITIQNHTAHWGDEHTWATWAASHTLPGEACILNDGSRDGERLVGTGKGGYHGRTSRCVSSSMHTVRASSAEFQWQIWPEEALIPSLSICSSCWGANATRNLEIHLRLHPMYNLHS